MSKDIEWVKEELNTIEEEAQEILDKYDDRGPTVYRFEERLHSVNVFRHLLNQLDEPEDTSQIDKLANFIMSEVEGEPSQNQGAVDTAIRVIKSYQNQETLTEEWIGEHTWNNHYVGRPFVYVDDLQNAIVPKQEEIDRAYKDGYEKGKQHTFYKGYLEGLADKESESETVADVIADFYKSCERLQGVMSMEVEELEE